MIQFLMQKVLPPAFITGWGYLLSLTALQITAQTTTISMFDQLVSLGVGGIIAAIVLWWKRQDDKEHADEIKILNEQHKNDMMLVITKSAEREEKMTQAFSEFSGSVDKLAVLVSDLSSRADLAANVKSLEEKVIQLTESRKDR